jgi:hypothetical protein
VEDGRFDFRLMSLLTLVFISLILKFGSAVTCSRYANLAIITEFMIFAVAFDGPF